MERDDWVAEPPQKGRRERWVWVGVSLLLSGLAVGAVALVAIARAMDRPGEVVVSDLAWWGVVIGGLLTAWSAPWFLRPGARRRIAIALAGPTVVLLGAAWWMLSRGG